MARKFTDVFGPVLKHRSEGASELFHCDYPRMWVRPVRRTLEATLEKIGTKSVSVIVLVR
jgi:hypothetical protein